MSFRALVIPAALGACSGDPPKSTPTGDTGDSSVPMGDDELEIAGVYVDAYGTTHAIDAATWAMASAYGDSAFHVSRWDNDADYLLAENDAANAWSAELWSRFDWIEVDGHLFFCQTAYDAADEETAGATPRANDTDPAGGGCGGFAWTDLTP